MHIERFDAAADHEVVRACHEIFVAAMPIDQPGEPLMSLRPFAGWLRMNWTEDVPQTWLARDGSGQPRGWYSLTLPARENAHLAYLVPVVSPAYRRRGAGTALVRHAAARAHEGGRAFLTAETTLGSPGAAFAGALGAQPGIAEASRVLDLRGIPAGDLARLRARAQAAAGGYSLLTWEGRTPEHYLDQVAALNQAGEDAPRDENRDEQCWDAARVRGAGDRIDRQGVRYYSVAARHDRTGELVALTQLRVDPEVPDWGGQELTVVARAHRGHRLGLLVKVAMLDLLADREPGVERIITGNADSNEHMIAINAEMGFRVLDHWVSWELAVAQVLALPTAAQS
jgi:RimJ/RimL family protein N-acetyltransferase/GNAT superfamily N-acetyltransferase